MMKRLDVFLVETGMTKSRTKAKESIIGGKVFINGKICDKPSYEVCEGDDVRIVGEICKYVSRAGNKLEKALCEFGIDVSGAVALDIGASTGGFTDCLLRHGASKVYAVDVGTMQLAPSLKSDSRVISRENTNGKSLKKSDFTEQIDIIVMDVSFISQRKLYYNVSEILSPGKVFVSLIKPQFELGRENIGKGGVVKDASLFTPLLSEMKKDAAAYGLDLLRTCASPILGGDGNREFLGYFIKQ